MMIAEALTNKEPFDTSLDYCMSTVQVAENLGCNQAFVVSLIDCGLLQAMRFGRTRRVRKITLNKFLADYDGCDLYALVKKG